MAEEKGRVRRSARGRPALLRFGDLSIEGVSRAGDATWFRVQPPGIAFDVGRGAGRLDGVREIFLSHGHLDHALGLPFLLARRGRDAAPHRRVFCHAELAAEVREFIDAAARLERAELPYEVVALAPGDRVELRGPFFVEAFATDHGVPSLGFHLYERRGRLAPEHRQRTPAELAALRRAGEPIEIETEVLRLAYCGDTGPGVFSSEPRLFEAEILMIECTFLAPEHRADAREWGHMHLDDLVAVAGRFENRALVLHHLSRRYPRARLEEAIAERLGGARPEVHVP